MFSTRAVFGIPFQNEQKEISKWLGFFWLDLESVDQQLLQVEGFEVVDASEVVLACPRVPGEVVVEHVSLHSEVLGAWSQHLHEQSQVVIVLLVLVLARPWVEQEVSGDQLEHHASIAPQVSAGVVVNAENHLWGSVLPGLNLRYEVVVRPAPISQITDFAVDGLIDQGPFDVHLLFLSQLLLCRIDQSAEVVLSIGWKFSIHELCLLFL
jgi:hypothetical protein